MGRRFSASRHRQRESRGDFLGLSSLSRFFIYSFSSGLPTAASDMPQITNAKNNRQLPKPKKLSVGKSQQYRASVHLTGIWHP
ncbi:hypothetical protein EMIT0158MI4_20345 [Burkholderia ambifaria]